MRESCRISKQSNTITLTLVHTRSVEHFGFLKRIPVTFPSCLQNSWSERKEKRTENIKWNSLLVWSDWKDARTSLAHQGDTDPWARFPARPSGCWRRCGASWSRGSRVSPASLHMRTGKSSGMGPRSGPCSAVTLPLGGQQCFRPYNSLYYHINQESWRSILSSVALQTGDKNIPLLENKIQKK